MMAGTGAPKLVHIDGTTLEGGGQLIRMSLCLSALTGTPIQITSIRGNRGGGGGLKSQHLACVNWLALACDAHVEGAEKGSNCLLFRPGPPSDRLSPVFKKKTLNSGSQVYESRLDIGTAGATTLALQAILPYILFTKFPSSLPIRLILTGGTNVSGSPSVNYVSDVLLPTLRRIGLPPMSATVDRRGWMTGSSQIGSLVLTINPRAEQILPGFTYTPSIRTSSAPSPATVHATILATQSLHSQLYESLAKQCATTFGPSVTLEFTAEDTSDSQKFYLLLIASFNSHPGNRHSTSLSSSPDAEEYILAKDYLSSAPKKASLNLGKKIPSIVEKLFRDLEQDRLTTTWTDEYLRDQLVIFQALTKGKSCVWGGWGDEDPGDNTGNARDDENERSKLKGDIKPFREPTLHTQTAWWIATLMLPGITFDEKGDCQGFGLGVSGDMAVGVEDDMSSLALSSR